MRSEQAPDAFFFRDKGVYTVRDLDPNDTHTLIGKVRPVIAFGGPLTVGVNFYDGGKSTAGHPKPIVLLDSKHSDRERIPQGPLETTWLHTLYVFPRHDVAQTQTNRYILLLTAVVAFDGVVGLDNARGWVATLLGWLGGILQAFAAGMKAG